MYTLVIKNATVIDGLGGAPFIADVGIENGKIKSIERSLPNGKETIDASGLTITLGFIDSHSHSDRNVVTFPDMKEKIEQGITFSITGQCGSSETPKVLKSSEKEETPRGPRKVMTPLHNSQKFRKQRKKPIRKNGLF